MTPTHLHPSFPAPGPICLGSSTFGREIDQATAFTLMDHAQARGVKLFDTAATYSAGVSESIIGAWLSSRRPAAGAPAIATKLYPPYTSAAIDAGVAASAARLGVETIDLLYLHKWDDTAGTPDAVRALDRLVRSGRVRTLGVSNFTADRLQAVLTLQRQQGLAPCRVLQNNHNLAIRDFDAPLRELSATENVAVITYSPLGAGFLTGKHRNGVQPGSRFAIVPGHQNIYFQPLAEGRLNRLAELSARTGRPMAHLALVWALHQPGIASVLIGGRTTAHLDQAFAALADNDPQLLSALDAC
jgi:aryl-alcohol dehydrogenase-like predicted oxidoreductase